MTQVAQRHDVTRQQIDAWRQDLKKKGLLSAFPKALFVPVELGRPMGLAVPHVGARAEAPSVAQVELQLVNGRDLRFKQGVDGTTLMQLNRAVDAA